MVDSNNKDNKIYMIVVKEIIKTDEITSCKYDEKRKKWDVEFREKLEKIILIIKIQLSI